MIFVILEHILTHISFSIIFIVIMIQLMDFLFVHEILELWYSSEKGMIAAFLSIMSLLIIRWFYSGHFPLSNLYESLIFLSWSFLIIHMILYFCFNLKNNKNKYYLSTITTPGAIFIQAFATSGLSSEMHQSKILIPALQSQWLMMHVSMMLLSYAALLFGSLFAIALLIIITFRENINIVSNLLIQKYHFFNDKKNALENTAFIYFKNYSKYQLTKKLDYWSSRVIGLGFIFLTIGILSGAVWANEVWGSYWNWDPKETWAFITWIIYGIYLHTRTKQSFHSINSAIVASIGFFIIWICYFGVNLLEMGFHNYGSFSFPSK